ncbi:neural Wiskott-Aldrich syndrome protein-like [Venturia canescens]|uniref:neural Wiskott-Aldrich syndrome protein-like n=1 Tax=Venturia canescens TaxID=32260 RepID=UPI001C9C2E1C|nr:neural Wiskott-Aldrich syndrome protein-like [Venturia canescens]XP_043285905.1 neural Wiskott-Aldrich syndrome protein-like [Venturia canescens]
MKSTGTKENRGSVLLNRDENDIIFKLIGNRCQCLAAGVIQLYLTQSPSHKEWIKRNAGVITLIRDNPRRSFFLRLYCLQRNAMLWEHEVYNSMEYNAPMPYFHTFEGEDSMVAFNFADETEAIILRNALLAKLNTNRQRRQERSSRMETESQNRVVTLPRKSPSSSSTFGFTSATNINMLNGSPSGIGVNRSVSSSSMYKTKKKDSKKDGKRKLTTADIGLPSDFRHLSGMRWNPDIKGIDISESQLAEFFNKVGVSEQELRNKKTRKFIYKFIEEHGGISAIQNDIIPTTNSQSSHQPPPLPPGLDTPPPIPARTIPHLSASPGSNSMQPRSARPLPPLRTTVPPAPPSAPPVHRSLPSRPPPPLNSPAPQLPPPPPPPPPPARGSSSTSTSTNTNTNTSPSTNVPPPPPPPLPDFSNNDNLTSTDSPFNNNGDTNDMRPKLMESIRSGTTLRKVSQSEVKPSPVPDSRNDLLDQIRRGIELKPVTTKTKSTSLTEPQGLAGALSRALAERSRALGNDSQDSSSGTSEDDDDWDD